MKKLLLLLTFCVTLTSCSSIKNIEVSNIEPPESSVSEMSSTESDVKSEFLQLTNCYKKEDADFPEDMVFLSTAFSLSDGSIIIFGSNSDYSETLLYKTDKSFSQFTPISYSLPEEAQNYDVAYDSISFNYDGTFNVIVTMEDHGGITLPKEWDENFDYESYNSNCITSYMICNYDSNGNLLNKSPIEYPEELFDDYGYLYSGGIMSDGDSVLQSFKDGSIRRIGSDGKLTIVYEIENPDDYVYTTPANLFRDRDGKIICAMHENKEAFDSNGMAYPENMLNFCELTESGVSSKSLYSCHEYDIYGMLVFGRGDYRLFIPTSNGLIGITDDGKTDIIVDWLNSGLECMQVVPCGESDFIGSEYNTGKDNIIKITPRDMSEFANTKMITIANCYDIGIINDFNNSQTDYRIQMVEYSYDDNSQLNLDIISGNAPDIICNLDYSTYLNYRKKGVFTDLDQFMNDDDELNRDKIMTNVITALENPDGKLNALCSSFNVSTMVAKTKFFDKENWTFDDMLNLYDNAPETTMHLYDGITKTDMFHTMFYSMNQLIDYNNATCDFNNQRFIQMLEFCNRFVDDVEMPDKFTNPEAHSQYYTDKYHWLENDQIFTEILDFNDLTSYNLVKYTQGGGADLTLVGYPSDNGKGGRITPNSLISINEKCEDKQGAWEFVKFYILESNEISELSGGYSNIYGIPSLTDSFEKAMDVEMKAKHSASGIEYPSYNQRERDIIEAYVKSCDSVGTVLDNDIIVICDEEAGLYFAGEQSAEDTAEHIQN
ncbi:MAG: extracellular solute-binding protein, partial [Ruminococcus sp.]|nr:extracellular solute-binding protein [Ruminococcus sp.]